MAFFRTTGISGIHSDPALLPDWSISDGDDPFARAPTSDFSSILTPSTNPPSLTTTARNPTYTEDGSRVSLFTGTSSSTNDSGETFKYLVFTVSGVHDGAAEALIAQTNDFGFFTISLVPGTKPLPGLRGEVEIYMSGDIATVVIASYFGVDATNVNQLVDSLQYSDQTESPTANDRIVTLTSLWDSGGGIASLSLSSTIHLIAINDQPHVTRIVAFNPLVVDGTPTQLFADVIASTLEPTQTFIGVSLGATGLHDGTNERLNIDGGSIQLVAGANGTTAHFSYAVTSAGGNDVAIALTSATGVDSATLQTILDGMTYQDLASSQTPGNRHINLNSVQDNGGTANGGVDTSAFVISGQVQVGAMATTPIFTGTGSIDAYHEGGSPVILEPAVGITTQGGATPIVGLGYVEIRNVQPGDRLTYNGQTFGDIHYPDSTEMVFSFSGSFLSFYRGGGGPLTLSTLQDFLQHLQFSSTSSDPDNNGATPTRDIIWYGYYQSLSGPSYFGTTSIDIVPANPPVAHNDAFFTDASAPIGSGLSLLADNGSGADSNLGTETLSLVRVNGATAKVGVQVTLSSGALLTVNADGTFSYDPNHVFDSLGANATASDGFTYSLNGGSTATVTMTIGHNTTATTYTGGPGNDVIHGGDAGNVFDMTQGGNDTVIGGSANDGFKFGANYTSADKIDGGGGTNNQMQLDGDYSGGVTLSGTSLANIQVVALMPGHNYTITTTDDLVGAAKTFSFWAASMTSANRVAIDGHLETNGDLQFFLGAGNDTAIGGGARDIFVGGDGQDTLTGNGGLDIFRYLAVSNSTGPSYDIITDFTSGTDSFDLPGTVTGVDTRVNGGALTTASFDTDLATAIGASQLAIQHAVIFAPTTGDLSGHAFLIVDANGVAGYQAGQDYVFDVTGGIAGGASSATVIIGDFV